MFKKIMLLLCLGIICLQQPLAATIPLFVGTTGHEYALDLKPEIRQSQTASEKACVQDFDTVAMQYRTLEKEGMIHPYFYKYPRLVVNGVAFGACIYSAFKIRTLYNKAENLRKIRKEFEDKKALKQQQDPLVDTIFASKGISYRHSPTHIIKNYATGSKQQMSDQALVARLHEPLDRLSENMQVNGPGMKLGKDIMIGCGTIGSVMALPLFSLAVCAQLQKRIDCSTNLLNFYRKYPVSSLVVTKNVRK